MGHGWPNTHESHISLPNLMPGYSIMETPSPPIVGRTVGSDRHDRPFAAVHRCRVALKSGTQRVGQRLLPLNVTFRRQLVGVFPCFAVQSGQLLQEDGALFQTHWSRQLLRTHRGQC